MIKQIQLVGGAMIAIAIIGIVLSQFLALPMISGDSDTTSNESITVDYDNLSSVDKTADSYGDTVTIYDSDDTELNSSTDYNWYSSNGTVEWLNTTETTDGGTASITYDWSTSADGPLSSVFTTLQTIGPAALTLLIIGLLVIAGRAIMSFMGGGF